MRVFLAGASGAVGRLLLPMLIEAGHAVTGTTRSANKADSIREAGGDPVILDVLDREATFAALADCEPDVVIHQLTDLAARDFAGNSFLRVHGTRNLVDAAWAAGAHRVIAQSIAWVSVAGDTPAREDEPLDLAAPDPRGSTVAAVQSLEYALAELPIGIVLRYGYLYGAGTWYSPDGLTTEQIRRGEISASDAVSSFTHVEDAARAALLALDWESGIYNIVDDEPAPASEWVRVYADLVGAPPPPITTGREGWQRGASNAKARALGWSPLYPSWRDGFKRELT